MLEMAVSQPCAVEAELFTELDDLQGALVTWSGVVLVEQSDGQESQPLQRAVIVAHAPSLWFRPRIAGDMIP